MTQCLQCNEPILSAHAKKFCSQSCSATYNNKRKVHKKSTKDKISQSITKYINENGPNRIYGNPKKVKHGKYMHKHRHCPVCGTYFFAVRVTCSEECKNKHLSNLRKNYLSTNAGSFSWINSRNTLSYFENNFKGWLESWGLIIDHDFEINKHFHNSHEKTSYFLDFYFPKLNLNIECDGTHHERKEQIERDIIRDEFLRSQNIDVIRISIREYNGKNNRQVILDDIKQILMP